VRPRAALPQRRPCADSPAGRCHSRLVAPLAAACGGGGLSSAIARSGSAGGWRPSRAHIRIPFPFEAILLSARTREQRWSGSTGRRALAPT
jgi:hypothetical protein